jgi:hypothetical protein
MKEHSQANERVKRKYFAFPKEAKRHSEPTGDAAAKALNRFEIYTRRLINDFGNDLGSSSIVAS